MKRDRPFKHRDPPTLEELRNQPLLQFIGGCPKIIRGYSFGSKITSEELAIRTEIETKHSNEGDEILPTVKPEAAGISQGHFNQLEENELNLPVDNSPDLLTDFFETIPPVSLYKEAIYNYNILKANGVTTKIAHLNREDVDKIRNICKQVPYTGHYAAMKCYSLSFAELAYVLYNSRKTR